MASSPRTARKNRIISLCAEIDRLILCHRSLPPGPVRQDVEDEVSERLVRINDLVQPGFLETSAGQRAAYTVSLFLVACGLLSGTYAAIGLGSLVAFVALVVFDTPSDH